MGTPLAKGDVALLHRRGVNLPQRMRAESRILQYIFQTSDEEGILARLEEVLTFLQLAYVANRATWPVSKALIRQICQRLEQHKMLYRLMIGNRALNTAASNESGEKLTIAEALVSNQDPVWHGWQTLTAEMYRYVGETGDNNIQFALWLLEEVLPLIKTFSQWHDEQAVQTAIDQGRLDRASVALTVILNAGRAPLHPDAVAKNWLNRLIEEADQNPAAEQVLESITNVMTMGTEDGVVFVATPKDEANSQIFFAYASSMPDPQRPVLFLSERHRKLFEGFEVRQDRKRTEDRKRGSELLLRFLDRMDEVEAGLERKCEEMSRGLRRGLRPDGADHIQITVGPLYNVGVRAIIFHPEGRTYPNVGVEILVRKETPHLISFMLELDLADTPEAESRMKGWREGMRSALWNTMYPMETLMTLMTSIIIDAMYRIVMPSARPLREPQNDVAGVKKPGTPKIAVSVRPFIRHLPPDHVASEEAVARAAEALGYRLPPGVTFVGAFYRGDKQIGYHLPEPFAGYTNDDVLHFLN